MLWGPAAGVQAAGPLRERSLRREGDMASVLPSGQPWMSAAAHAMLGGPAAGVHAAGRFCELSLWPGADMASVLVLGRAALGGSTCDAGGVSCTADAAGGPAAGVHAAGPFFERSLRPGVTWRRFWRQGGP